MYKLENIRKVYQERVVLDIPDLSLPAGRIYVFVGPNGAGKTTLLNLLAFLDTPTEGKILFHNTPVPKSGAGLLALRRRLTLVMQEHLLFDTSVYHNLAYGLRKRGVSGAVLEARVREALRLVGLGDFARRQARTLSGGEGKRLALARALVLEPQILLLDEPTAHIDRQNAESIEQLILQTHREKQTTIICTTHNLHQAYRLGDKVMSLVEGRVVESAPENIFAGELHSGPGLKWMQVAPGIKIWLDTPREGRAHISIDPRNIIISRTALASSARNTFRGKITRALWEGRQVKLLVAAGVEFTVFITRNSFEEMALKPAEEIFLSFKSSSVVVL